MCADARQVWQTLFRLVNPDELTDVCAQRDLTLQTRTRLAGQVMQFSSR